MARVSFTPNLQRHVSCPSVDVAGRTVREVLDGVFAENAKLRSYVLDEHGRLRRHVNVFVNERAVGDRAALSDAIGPGDTVFVFQALSGG
ncbi:MAG: MoaD/ThiS family protein [Alphaproteobacteria bacterium]